MFQYQCLFALSAVGNSATKRSTQLQQCERAPARGLHVLWCHLANILGKAIYCNGTTLLEDLCNIPDLIYLVFPAGYEKENISFKLYNTQSYFVCGIHQRQDSFAPADFFQQWFKGRARP